MSYGIADVVARLYSVPPDEFMGERIEAVERAKAAGDGQLAAQISKLRKPSLAAWLVNLLAHQRPELIDELLALGDELRAAQRELRGSQLRDLSLRRRTTVAALIREARALAVAAGRPVPEKMPLAEVEQTLTAALADSDTADEVRAGRLTRPREYAGFGETPRPQLRLLHGGRSDRTDRGDRSRDREQVTPDRRTPPSTKKPGATKQSKQPKQPSAGTTSRAEQDQRAEQERRAEEQRRVEEARRAEEERRIAERMAVVERAKAVKAARRELLAASQQLMDARTAHQAAERTLAATARAVSAAQDRVDKLQAVLKKLDSGEPAR